MTASTTPPDLSDDPSVDAIPLLRLCAPASGFLLLLIGVLLWHSDRTFYFQLLGLWGVPALPSPFADWNYVVNFMQCAHRGMNVYGPNQCGTFIYTPLWTWAHLIPRGPVWSDGFGLAIDASFFASLWFAGRPENWRDAAVFVVASMSTASIYGAERANIDLIIFVLVIVGAALAGREPARRVGGYLLILLAGLLKFYPFAAFAVALRERTLRFVGIAIVAMAALAALLLYMRADLAPLAANLPGGHYGSDAFGASNVIYLLQGVGASKPVSILAFAFLGLCASAAALSLGRNSGFVSALFRTAERDRTALVIASAVVVGCFFAGQSIIYRAIFLIPVVGGLCALRRAAPRPGLRSRLALLIGASLVIMWEGAVHKSLFPDHRIPAVYLLLREALWWWVVANLAAVLIVFAETSEAFDVIRPLLPGWIASKAEKRAS
ncbi:MAG TPA: hypothetical protein VGF71_11055 [Caulobacteraceae bacterium]